VKVKNVVNPYGIIGHYLKKDPFLPSDAMWHLFIKNILGVNFLINTESF
jgi:hypothetical protein